MMEQEVRILLVEDNPGDVLLIQEAFIEILINNIEVAIDGQEALDILFKKDKYKNFETPDIILLDLNLPKKSGPEVLEVIKNDDKLKHIPVIVLTSSQAEMDIVKTYNLHANSYVIKPLDFDDLIKVVKSIRDFWFKVVKLPPRDE